MSRQKGQGENLTRRFEIRFTPEDAAYILEAADASGLSVSELVRRKLFDLRIPDRTDTKMLNELINIRSHLWRLGGLFKHLYSLNPVYSKETAAGLQETIHQLAEINKMYEALNALINRRKQREEKEAEDAR